jgi:hypothetical protein
MLMGIRLGLSLALGFSGAAAAGCGGSSTDDDENGESCSIVEGCGGDVVDTWNVVGLCAVSSPASPLPECENLLTIDQIDASGQIEFTADGQTLTAFQLDFHSSYRITGECLSAQAQQIIEMDEMLCDELQASASEDPTVNEVTCRLSGATCLCSVSFSTDVSGQGGYSIDGNDLIGDDGSVNPYCISDDEFRLTVEGADGTLTYTFRRAG